MEAKLKYLEFIQAAISRMAQNSFLIKGWAITLVSACIGVGGAGNSWKPLVASVVITPAFWALDAFFVSLERRFRGLYDHVRVLDASAVDFSFDLSDYRGSNSWFGAVASPHLLLFYVSLGAATLVSAYLIVA